MAEKTRDQAGPPSFLRPLMSLIGGRRTVQVFMKLASPVDRFLIPATGGRLSTGLGMPMLVMEVVGAKSGKRRRTPLLCMREGDDLVIVASYGGNQRHPAWYYNLRANPRVRVWAKGINGWFTARQAEGEERERLWQAATEFYEGYRKYETYTDREIQIFVLSPEG